MTIYLDKQSHVYHVIIHGKNFIYKSVSSVLKKHFDTFNEEKALARVTSKEYWINHEYYGKTRNEIKDVWRNNNKRSMKNGTKLHAYIEDYYNYTKIPDISKDNIELYRPWQQFLKFKIDNPFLEKYKVEWMIYDSKIDIAGTVDVVFLNKKTGKYELHDWKLSKSIPKQSFDGKKLLLPELNHIDCSSFNQYAFQLNFYKYILENNYNIKIDKMVLDVFHHTRDQYVQMIVPDLEKEVKFLMTI
jgi:hypothetical protein